MAAAIPASGLTRIELVRPERLRAVGDEPVGIRVNLDHEAVGPGSHRCEDHGHDLAPGTRGRARIHDHRPVRELMDDRHGGNVEDVPGVWPSKPRPRSHRITCGLPSAKMYSVLRRSSSMVAAIQRLGRIGFPVVPRLGRAKFCMFHEPICMMSLHSATATEVSASSASVTMTRPVLTTGCHEQPRSFETQPLKYVE
jgi:hypothetical protein